MKKYRVNVNGTVYEVELEEITGGAAAAPAAAAAPVATPAAMKMENEIMCPCDGKVLSVSVSKGATVESGALLCVIG